MDLSAIVFKRKFSLNFYKNQKILLGKMSFAKDFVNDKRGDLYPLLAAKGDLVETVENGLYFVREGCATRFFCQFFPYATYRVASSGGKVGFCFSLPCGAAEIYTEKGELVFVCGQVYEATDLPEWRPADAATVISCRPGAFDVYFEVNGKAQFFRSFETKTFANCHDQAEFSRGSAALVAAEGAVVREVESYIDSGLSIADIRPIRYEDGTVMTESGKIYLTATVRMQVEMFQGVFSWIPGTAEFCFVGAVFYDSGDGKWCGDVAASVLYNRNERLWYLWVCSFNHDHILGHAAFEGDPRFGVNIVDITLLDRAVDGSDETVFAGVYGDEDPDFYYDANTGKWHMAICRRLPETGKYGYVFFESDSPFDGYRYIGKGKAGAETGGSFVKIDGERYFICGNDFHTISDYRIYSKDGMTNAHFDHPDGGFRGWGTVIPVKQATRTRLYWLTFDRHNASDYNWSYGNLYCFEA